MHQSLIDSSHLYHSFSDASGLILSSPAFVRYRWRATRSANERNVAWRSGTHLDSLISHSFAADPPLGLHDGFNDIARLGTDGNVHGVVLSAHVEVHLLELLDDLVPGVEAFHALELGSSVGVERAVVIKNIDKFELVAHADFVVVGIVSRCHFDGTGTESHINCNRVSDDRDATIQERVKSKLAVQVLRGRGLVRLVPASHKAAAYLVALIVRVHGDGSVT